MEEARIHAAEQRANREMDELAGNKPVGETVPYASLLPKKKMAGVLTQVDCLSHGTRLLIKIKTGQSNALLLPETAAMPLQLTCGPQKVARRVTLLTR